MQTVCNTYWDAGKGNLTAQNTRKTLRRPELRPGPRWGSLQLSHKPLVDGDGLAVPSPKTSSPALDPSGLASPTPTPKLVPTPLTDKQKQVKNITSLAEIILIIQIGYV